MKKLRQGMIENAVVFFCALSFAGALTFYFMDIPLLRYFYEFRDDQSAEEIGKVLSAMGSVQKKKEKEGVFLKATSDSPLFRDDTLVTGVESSVTLALNDGSKIEMGASSMLKLSMERDVSLTGVARVPTVEVLSGQVQTTASQNQKLILKYDGKKIAVSSQKKETIQVAKNQAPLAIRKKSDHPEEHRPNGEDPLAIRARMSPLPNPLAGSSAAQPSPSPQPVIAPSPVPTPVHVQVKFPPQHARLILADPMAAKGRDIELSWEVNPSNIDLILTIEKSTESNKSEKVAERVIHSILGKATTFLTLETPGNYLWSLRADNSKPHILRTVFKGDFSIDPFFPGLPEPETWIAGEKMKTNSFQSKLLKTFDIRLTWKGHPQAKAYKVTLSRDPNMQTDLVSNVLKETEMIFNQDKVYNGTIYLRVSALLPGGFVAESPIHTFNFTFNPPDPLLPEENKKFSRRKFEKIDKFSQGGILFSWSITNFTEFYQFEIASDPDFKSLVVSKNLKDNFFIFPKPPAKTYWWRVRSATQRLQSDPTPARRFVVTP